MIRFRQALSTIVLVAACESASADEPPGDRTYRYLPFPRSVNFVGVRGFDDPTLPFISADLIGPEIQLETVIDPGGLGGPFAGLQLKLSRTGSPGNLVIEFGSKWGKNDLGCSEIEASEVMPLFDVWYDAAIPPVSSDGGRVFVRIRSSGSDAENFFTLYGPGNGSAVGDGDPGASAKGAFPFSSRILRGWARPPEDVFDFVKSFTERPLNERSTLPRVRSPRTIRLDGSWILEAEIDERVVETAARDFTEFLKRNFAVSLAVSAGRNVIRLAIRESARAGESFRIAVTPREILVEADSSRGVMRGLYWIEDEMIVRRSPDVPLGVIEKTEVVERRIAAAVQPGAIRKREIMREWIYTDDVLKKMSRDGFNAIWIFVNLEQIATGSALFPELDDPAAPRALANLALLTERAQTYGIDVYAYLATGYDHRVPEVFYDVHPELEGAHSHALLSGAMCTSQEIVRRYQAGIIRNLFDAAPLLRGLIVIYDSEGFVNCGSVESVRRACPRCSKVAPEALALQLLTNIREAVPSSAELVAWNYTNRFAWIPKLIPLLPPDIVWMVDFTKGGVVEHGGVSNQTEDYSITLIGPAGYLSEQQGAVREAGLTLYAKTEHGGTPEFTFVPYVPAFDRWYDRAVALRRSGARGWLENWSHYGYLESLPARLFNSLAFDPVPEREALLGRFAAMYYGAEAAPEMRLAWSLFSEAMEDFPYSIFVVKMPGPLQKGPSHPFLLDRARPKWGSWRTWQNDLRWTEPWGVDLAREQLSRVREGFRRGVEAIDRGAAGTDSFWRERIEREACIGRSIVASLDTVIRLIDWIPLREDLNSDDSDRARAAAMQMRSIAEKELAGTAEFLRECGTDSRIGFGSDGGGIVRSGLFTRDLIEWKVDQIRDVIESLDER